MLTNTGWRAAMAVFAVTLLIPSPFAFAQSSTDQLELNRGDHICILGNTLADRMQHHGWLETELQLRHPAHDLVIRNLGFSADTLKMRLRSANFGNPDRHLTDCRADVVFLMFGYNESFEGEAGLAPFRQELTEEIEHLRSQKYNGMSAPRVVIVSPIAHENMGDPNLPDGAANNARLVMYRDAMADVAREQNVPFVDLFDPMAKAYAETDEPLTINGIHLTSEGNRVAAAAVADALFGEPVDASLEARRDAVRAAVLDKNFYWYNYYRTTDGYSIFGGRSELKFVDGQTNREVMKREMEILQQMTANRDPAVWAAAQGKKYEVDDSNLPPLVPVVTNKPGEGPNGEHLFLSGKEAISRMKLLDGFEVNLFASEEMFPELINPVQMAFDTRGRLWVAAWASYPHWKPGDPMDDRLLILEDTDGDGVADDCKTFAGGLHNPTGFEFWGGGVLVARGPEVLFLKDVDGDDVCDVREMVVMGLDTADTHHTANSFTLGPGGGMYFQEGVFHHTQVESPWGPPVRNINAAVYRYDPRRQEFSVYAGYGFANPHGHVFDRWGRDIIHDGTGSDPYDGALISGRLNFPDKHNGAPKVYDRRTRPCPATEIVSSSHFPDNMQGELLVQNVIGDLGILRYRISEEGSSLKGEELEPLLLSDDQNFRPVDMEFSPRGELFFTDWSNPVIGHMQHNLRDPSRDQVHGRVYRLVHRERPLGRPLPVADAPLAELVAGLASPENRVRHRIRIELSDRPTDEVLAAVDQWIQEQDPQDPEYTHHLLEALWVHQQHNVPDAELLDRLLEADDFRARGAATRVLSYWVHRLDGADSRLVRLAGDEHPRVRLEAVRAASFLDAEAGLAVVIAALARPTDRYLDYVLEETMRAYSETWKQVIAEQALLAEATQPAVDFMLRRMTDSEVQRVPLDSQIARHLLYRAGIGETTRLAAIETLAAEGGGTSLDVLLGTLESIDPDAVDGTVVYELVRLMTRQPPEALKTVRDRLQEMAVNAPLPLLRQIGWIGMMTADGEIGPAWNQAIRSRDHMIDLVSAVPQIPDAGLQEELFPRIFPFLSELPEALQEPPREAAAGRYIRISLPGRRGALTLAEVEVYSGGTNIAPRGTASQQNTAHNGDASRAIDGNKSPRYADGGQTHTSENSTNSWWELDLGGVQLIERVVIFNRGENFAQRLDQFTLEILDADRQVVFQSANNPAPELVAEFETGQISKADLIQRAAIDAVTYVRGKETLVFQALARLILADQHTDAAVRALQRVPVNFWDQDQVAPLVSHLMNQLRGYSEARRTSAEAADRIQAVELLTSLMPATEAAPIRSELADLGVRIIRLGTRPHRMSYDKEVLVVKAGRQIEILFENTDMMPHNLVVTLPGAMEEIGMQAEETAQQKNAIARHYVPRSSKVLLSSRLIQPGEQERLSFKVPSKPGIYPYVCTYPGHWRRMFGSLIVVRDPDAYAANPAQYLADNGIVIADELLKLNMRTKTEWKPADFDDVFVGTGNALEGGRDFAQGEQMFKIASCISCHKMGDQGYEIGPNLTADLDPKWTPKDVLREILEPSKKIDDKYKTRIFSLETGEIVSGIVTFEDDDVVHVVENPLVASDPKVIEKFAIEDSRESDVSVMPKGLLDTLSREEILDLMAYIVAKGKADHPLFTEHAHEE